jgi:hypothetical protein
MPLPQTSAAVHPRDSHRGGDHAVLEAIAQSSRATQKNFRNRDFTTPP